MTCRHRTHHVVSSCRLASSCPVASSSSSRPPAPHPPMRARHVVVVVALLVPPPPRERLVVRHASSHPPSHPAPSSLTAPARRSRLARSLVRFSLAPRSRPARAQVLVRHVGHDAARDDGGEHLRAARRVAPPRDASRGRYGATVTRRGGESDSDAAGSS